MSLLRRVVRSASPTYQSWTLLASPPMPADSARDLDVAVLGASSVTGRRVAAYLADRAGETGMRWAAVGRSPEKIERVLAEEGAEAPETISADVGDAASLNSLAARAKVVLNLVGPYTLHGRPVIEA